MQRIKALTNALTILWLCLINTANAATGDTWVANGDGTVIDIANGLIWEQQDDFMQQTHAEATAYCQDLSLGGNTNWRLPNIKELLSVVDYRSYAPAIDMGAFTNPVSSPYWSASSLAQSSSDAWVVDFDEGRVGFFDKSTFNWYVRCVR